MADAFEARNRAELDQFLTAPESPPTRPDGTPGPAPAPAAPPAKAESDPAIPTGAIAYGWQIGKHALGVGVHNILDGLNDMYNPARSEIGGPTFGSSVLNLRSQVRGAAKVITGLFQAGLSPIQAGAGTLGQAIENISPTLANYEALTDPKYAASFNVAMDPFGAVGMMLESPESLAKMTDAQRAEFMKKAEDYQKPVTVRQAIETAASLAMVIAAANRTSGGGKEPAKPGETAKPAAETKPPAAEPATPKAEPGGEAPPGPEAAIKEKLPPITDEEAMAFAQRVNAEPPPEVPPPGTEGPRVFGVNWQRLGQEESVKRVILDVNKTLTESGQSAEAARGVRSHETTTEAAKGVGLTVEDVLKLEPGTAVNAETMTALRGVRDVAARKLMIAAEFAKAGDLAARGDLPTMIALNHEINLRVKGATAEAGRTLESMKMPSDLETSGTNVLEFQNLVEKINGMPDIDKAAGMLTKLSARPGALRQFVNNLGHAAKTGKDIIWELYVNSLLSGPKTLAKKVLSDGLRAGWEIPERAVARANHQLFFRNDPAGVQSGEVGAMARGFAKGAVDMVRTVGRDIAQGPEREVDLGTGLGESHPYTKAITAENLGLKDTPLERIADRMGDLVRSPGTAIGYATDLAKSANYSMEMGAQAVRQAKFEGRTGADFTKRVEYIEANPAEFPQIADAAKQASLLNTFTQEMGPRGQGLAAFLNDWGGRAVVPFLRVPWNITKFGVQSVVGPLSSEFRQAWNLGGAAREQALAQWQMGAMLAAGTAYLVTQGRITGDGPKDRGLQEIRRAQGIPKYSLKIGDYWYGYHTAEPVGGIIGLAADFTQLWGQLPDEGEPFDKAMEGGAAVAMAFGRAMQDKSYFTGLREILDAMMGPDKKAEALAKSWARALIPAGARQFDQAYWDTTMREAKTPLDAMAAVTPGYSATLPPHRNPITGEAVEFPPALGPTIASPIPMVEQKADPVYQEILDHQIRIPLVPWSIAGTAEPFIQINEVTQPQGVPLTPHQRDHWITLMTSDRIAGRTLYDALDHLFATPKYQSLPKGPESDARQLEVGLVMRAYRERARLQLLHEDPELRAAAKARETGRLTDRLPTTNPRSTGIPALTPTLGR